MSPSFTVDLIRMYIRGEKTQQLFLDRVRKALENRYLASRMGIRFEWQQTFRSARYRFVGVKGKNLGESQSLLTTGGCHCR